MNIQVALTCLLIVVARITDVSLGTLRTVSVVRGRRAVAFFLGFAEILIWLIVISRVIKNLNQPAYIISYALGFALGTYVGITLESWVAAGRQVVRIFTREGPKLARDLRKMGYMVTQFEGQGKEGPISMLFLETSRKNCQQVVSSVLEVDPDCFYIIDDIRLSSGRRVRFHSPTGWRAIAKKK